MNDTKKILCKYFVHGACKKGESCAFSHKRGDQANMVCVFYQRGVCSYGSNCRYDHVKLDKYKHQGNHPRQTVQPPTPMVPSQPLRAHQLQSNVPLQQPAIGKEANVPPTPTTAQQHSTAAACTASIHVPDTSVISQSLANLSVGIGNAEEQALQSQRYVTENDGDGFPGTGRIGTQDPWKASEHRSNSSVGANNCMDCPPAASWSTIDAQNSAHLSSLVSWDPSYPNWSWQGNTNAEGYSLGQQWWHGQQTVSPVPIREGMVPNDGSSSADSRSWTPENFESPERIWRNASFQAATDSWRSSSYGYGASGTAALSGGRNVSPYDQEGPVDSETSQEAGTKKQQSMARAGLVEASQTNGFSSETAGALGNPIRHTKDTPLCSAATTGSCGLGAGCNRVHGDICPHCKRACLHPLRPEEAADHKKNCERNKKKLDALRRSQEIECSVCLERVLSKVKPSERKFGILSHCDHPHCIGCIRGWRNAATQGEATGLDLENAIRSCPVCRVQSHFITPSVVWYFSPAEKDEIIKGYKRHLSMPTRTAALKKFIFATLVQLMEAL